MILVLAIVVLVLVSPLDWDEILRRARLRRQGNHAIRPKE